jgi:hypothetical protein
VPPGSYPGPDALINATYGGSYKVAWTESVVNGTTSWTADITYTNVTSTTLMLNCQDFTEASDVSEILSGSSGNDGTFAASSTTCTANPTLAQQIQAGASLTLYAIFGYVPWPGSDVAITWGSAGTSASVDPFSS